MYIFLLNQHHVEAPWHGVFRELLYILIVFGLYFVGWEKDVRLAEVLIDVVYYVHPIGYDVDAVAKGWDVIV